MANELKHRKLTEQIIKAFYKVYNTLGYGFLEKVYSNIRENLLNPCHLCSEVLP